MTDEQTNQTQQPMDGTNGTDGTNVGAQTTTPPEGEERRFTQTELNTILAREKAAWRRSADDERRYHESRREAGMPELHYKPSAEPSALHRPFGAGSKDAGLCGRMRFPATARNVSGQSSRAVNPGRAKPR